MLSIQGWMLLGYFSQYLPVIVDKSITPAFNLFELCCVGVVSVDDSIELLFDFLTVAAAYDFAEVLALSFECAV